MRKVNLDFMVVPELLATMAVVKDPVRLRFVDPEGIFLTGLLGESGRKLVLGGIEFYFTGELASKLIHRGIAVQVDEPEMNPEQKTEKGLQDIIQNLYDLANRAINAGAALSSNNSNRDAELELHHVDNALYEFCEGLPFIVKEEE